MSHRQQRRAAALFRKQQSMIGNGREPLQRRFADISMLEQLCDLQSCFQPQIEIFFFIFAGFFFFLGFASIYLTQKQGLSLHEGTCHGAAGAVTSQY